jgi:hypothetical protein
MTPTVVFSENNAGGAGGAVAGLLGRRAAAVTAVAGGIKFKEAQTSMLVADSRSGVQAAAAEGSTRKAALRLGAGLFGGGIGAAGGGYGNTNEGKIIAAAFMDNYNSVVKVVRHDPSLQRNVGTLRLEGAAGCTKTASAVLQRSRRALAEDRERPADVERIGRQQASCDPLRRRRARGDWRRAGRLHQRAERDTERLSEGRSEAEV